MIRPGFLDSESRLDLIELASDGSAAHRLSRRANALVLLDKGMSCQSIAEVLLLDGDYAIDQNCTPRQVAALIQINSGCATGRRNGNIPIIDWYTGSLTDELSK
jgi:hypothetical protein